MEILKKMKIVGLEKFLYIDPDTNFWVYANENEEKEIRNIYRDVKDELSEEMSKHRFGIDVRTIYFNPTDRCNASCPYCYIPERKRKYGKSMTYEEISGYLNMLGEYGVDWIIFHGAEPLIVKDLIFDAIDDFPEFNFGLQTNGFLLNEEDVEFIKNREVNIGVSFDSPKKDVEDFLRGRGHYDKVVEIIEMMKGYPKFNVITTITKYNFEDLPEMIDFLVGKVPVVLMNIVRGTSEVGRNLRINASESLIKAVERAIEHTKNGRRIVVGDFANYILGILAPSARVLQCDVSPCGAAKKFVALATDGFYPCSEFVGLEEFRRKVTGYTEDILSNILDTYKSVRGRIVENIEECRTCPFRNICGSPCPAEVYSEFGTFFVKSPSCEYYKEVIEHAFRVVVRGDYKYVLKIKNLKKKYAFFES